MTHTSSISSTKLAIATAFLLFASGAALIASTLPVSKTANQKTQSAQNTSNVTSTPVCYADNFIMSSSTCFQTFYSAMGTCADGTIATYTATSTCRDENYMRYQIDGQCATHCNAGQCGTSSFTLTSTSTCRALHTGAEFTCHGGALNNTIQTVSQCMGREEIEIYANTICQLGCFATTTPTPTTTPTASSSAPDFVVRNITVPTSTNSTVINVIVQIHNIGNAPGAVQNIMTRVNLRNGQTLTINNLSTQLIPAQVTNTYSLTARSSVASPVMSVEVTADSRNNTRESNEVNNSLLVNFSNTPTSPIM